MDSTQSSMFSYNIILKIILIVSISFTFLDLYQMIKIFSYLMEVSVEINPEIFEKCVKFQSINDICYCFFGVLIGISASILSFGLIVNVENLTFLVFFDTFLYFNYLVFGPYLLAASLLGFYHFEKIGFVCDKDMRKYVNFGNCLCLIFSLSFSSFITIVYSVFDSFEKFNKSIRYEPEGNYILGKIFWNYIRNHSGVVPNVNNGINQNNNSL